MNDLHSFFCGPVLHFVGAILYVVLIYFEVLALVEGGGGQSRSQTGGSYGMVADFKPRGSDVPLEEKNSIPY